MKTFLYAGITAAVVLIGAWLYVFWPVVLFGDNGLFNLWHRLLH